jgi:Rhs element Vgr protein
MAAAGNTKGDVVTYTIKVGGSAIPDVFTVHSVNIEKKINRISTAKIVVLDGEANTGKFDVSSSDTFIPGAEVSIEVGYDANNQLVFKGIVTRQSIRIDATIGSALEIECRDAAVKMIVGRKSLSFSNKKDSDIISAIIATYSDLSADVTTTTTVWPQQIQHYATDWDFVLSLAESNGLIVTTLNGKVTVSKPDANTSSVTTVKFGDGLMEFNADLNAITQLGSVKATAWDYKNQKLSTASATSDLAGPGNLSSKKLSEVVGLDNYQLQSSTLMESADLTNWTKAQLIKSEYSKIQGVAKFQGTSIVDPGKYITLQGVGDRFNGDHLISGVSHDISDGNWLTEASIGLSSTWFIEEPDVMAPAASGLLPGARGLFNGTVKQMHEDPDTQYRILVDIPLFDNSGAGVWARLSNFYSTSGAGLFFLPEVGDEVVIGFLNEDPRYPVILGSMYSGTKLKPYTGLDPIQKNSLKAIVSKSGIFIQFDDDKKIFTIQTPAKNTMILSDDEKTITINDQNKNSIVMSADGIKIKSAGNINIEADKNMVLKGNMGVKIQAPSGDVEVTGINIKESASAQYSAEGSATAKVSGGAQLTLKGAMVMIN